MPTFKSGAFVQQCFSSHPLSLSFKNLTGSDRVVVICANCNLRHRFIISRLSMRSGNEEAADPEGVQSLSRCAVDHPTELRLSAVDVVSDSAKLRCAECRRIYYIGVASFESYRKDA